MELNEQLRQRMGVVVVGPSGAGKSTLWRMLRAALGKTGKVVSTGGTSPLEFNAVTGKSYVIQVL